MNITLVASSSATYRRRLERHVGALARGLADHGARVEVLALDAGGGVPDFAVGDGVVVRRFPATSGPGRFGVLPALWEHLCSTSRSVDVVHVHSAQAALGVAVASSGARRLVFTPHAPIERLLRWPAARMTRAVVERAAQTICSSRAEASVLRATLPGAADRITVVPSGVDVTAIRAAVPFARPGHVVLSVGRLERHSRVDRAIAAMASLDPAFRLVIVGNGPARRWLEAYAADLEVSRRVEFVGQVSDVALHRWLRTARVVVRLSDQQASGVQVLEALSAGAPVVASDIPVHREVASYAAGPGVMLVSPDGSPLEVAYAIAQAAGVSVPRAVAANIPSWQAVVRGTLGVYEALSVSCRLAAIAVGEATQPLHRPAPDKAPDIAVGG
jgi:glycosyltransferase involved in cell wall biosynthesis